MFDFDALREEGKQGLKEWHNKTYQYGNLVGLVPSASNDHNMSWEDLKEAFPMLISMMKNSPQDPEHHFEGDVWTHTKMVMEEMFASEYYLNADFKEKEVLFWSTFLHDVAKPLTVERNMETGGISNPDHSNKGAQDQRLFMWRNGFDPVLREHVSRVIKFHQKPFHWHKEMSVFELRSLSQWLPIGRLLAMARADARGRRSKTNHNDVLKRTLENLELMEYLAEENDCLHQAWQHPFESVQARKIYFEEKGCSHEDRPVHYDGGSDVIFLCGLPASGKNFWVDHFGEERPVLSYDAEREKLGLKSGKKDGMAVQIVKEKAKELLRKKEPFIFNATHINEELRSKNLSLLNQYNATVRIVHLEADPNELKKRNRDRLDSIPESVIENMARRWTPPSPHEGHEVIWWDKKKNVPIYEDFITTQRDPNNPWKFSK